MYYPDVFDPDISKKISKIMEFRYLESPMNLFPYQEFVRRYMSPYTSYNYLILYHGLGSGKTIAALSVAVDHYKHSKRKTIIVTRGDSAEDNFRNQIKKYESLTGYTPDPKIFTYYHYIQLSNIIRNTPESNLSDLLSDHIVIMDEVHNLKDMEEGGTLDNICKAIRLATDSKFLFSTATPMINSASEIVSLLRLANRDLPVSYTNSDLEYCLKGIISYSEIATNKPKENIIGNKVINGASYYVSVIKGTQLRHYMNEYKKGIRNMYTPLINISLFCLPDGTTGTDITRDCMTVETLSSVYKNYSSEIKTVTHKHYLIKDKYQYLLQGDELEECSVVYKSVIDIIKVTKGKIFIFLEYVQGSGIILLNSILEAQGFELYEGGMIPSISAKRYTYCVGDKELTPNILDRIDGYNDPLNDDGEYVQILIGSRVIGESISLLNVKQFHFISPHWNISSLNQAKGRVIREGSHKGNNPVVDIYIHLAIMDSITSIDEYKILTSDHKQHSISLIENKMKEYAVDRYVYGLVDYGELDNRSLVAIHSRSYIPRYIDKIASYIPCSIEYILKKMNVFCKEMIIEIIRLIIINNIEYNGMYLRASPIKLYFTHDITIPFYGFERLPNRIYTRLPVDIDVNDPSWHNKYRYIPLIQKIRHIENAFANNNIDFLQKVPALFLEYNNCYYHILYYKDVKKAYNASVLIPPKLLGRTRVFDNSEWKYITDERYIIDMFRSEYKQLVANNDIHPFFGYISVIDGKTRYRQKGNMDEKDSRKINRGISLSSMTISNLKTIVENLNISVDSDSKIVIIDAIEEYMFNNNLYCYI
jgi:hypothetical protein